MTNCTFVGNTAFYGGGINNNNVLNLTNCTITGNTAYFGGGGLRAYSSAVTLTNTIVAGNSFFGGDISGNVSGSNNLIGTGGSGGLQNGVDGNLVGVFDPLLGSLGNYGGTTQTVPLLPGSPAIAAGTTAAGITMDQRGLPLDPNGIDIGAFQSQGFTLALVPGSSPQSADILTQFASPLAVTVTANNPVEPVDGGSIGFAVTPSAGGASAQLSTSSATIAGGEASVTATANSVDGSYVVTGSIVGASVTFSLSNTGYVSSIAVTPADDDPVPGALGATDGDGHPLRRFDGGDHQHRKLGLVVVVGDRVHGEHRRGHRRVDRLGADHGGVRHSHQPRGHRGRRGAAAGPGREHDLRPVLDLSTVFAGLLSLREAVDVANAVPGETITFDPTVFGTPQTIYLSQGPLELSDTSGTTTIMGPGGGLVTVSGGHVSGVFQIDTGVTASISGLTITGGSTFFDGAGILNSGTLTLTDVKLSGNDADFRGGGIFDQGGDVYISGGTISGNSGGGACVSSSGKMTITGATVSNNEGGGVYVGSGSLTITNTAVTGNDASYGGGVGVLQGTATITGSTFLDNSSSYGGAISNNGVVTLTNCTISDNTADSRRRSVCLLLGDDGPYQLHVRR